MCSYIYNYFYGYDILEQVDRQRIVAGTSHILLIKNKGKLKVRKYKNIYDFHNINLNKIELYYNKNEEKLYTGDYTSFDYLTVPEFINLVLPKQELDIYYITLDSYLDNSMIHDFYEKVYMNDGYMCKCKNSCNKCLYHEFISENLYKKYIKNDSSSENTDICHKHDDGWSLV